MLKPASVLLIFQILNRFWSMKKPLLDPGQARIIEKSGCSRKTVERALQALERDRPCSRGCGRAHPLILVREHGRSQNATIQPFTCDMVSAPRRPRADRDTQPIAKTEAIPLPLVPVRQYDAAAAEIVPRHNDALAVVLVRQNVATYNGTEKPNLETHAKTRANAADQNQGERTEARAALRSMGVHESQIAHLIDVHGACTCLRQARFLPYRQAYEKSTNRPGLLISAIRANWEEPAKAVVAATRAAVAIDETRRHEARAAIEHVEQAAYAERIESIASRVSRGDISEDDALQEVHRRPFHPDPKMARIERTIAARQLTAALAKHPIPESLGA